LEPGPCGLERAEDGPAGEFKLLVSVQPLQHVQVLPAALWQREGEGFRQ
jgi:hypothetical protein